MDDRLATEAIRQGLLTFLQFKDCADAIDAARLQGKNLALSEALVSRGYLTPEQVRTLSAPPLLPPRPKPVPRAVRPPEPPKAGPKNRRILIGSIAGGAAVVLILLIVALSSGPNPPPRSPAPVARPPAGPDLSKSIGSLTADEKYAEALGLIDARAAASDAARYREMVLDAANHALHRLRISVKADLMTGSYAAALEKLERFRRQAAALPDVAADVDHEIALVRDDQKKNEIRSAEDDYTRILPRLEQLASVHRFDDALEHCRQALSRTTNPHLQAKLREKMRQLEGLKAAAGPAPEPPPAPAPAPEPAPGAEPPPASPAPGVDLAAARQALKSREWDRLLRILGSDESAEPLSLRARALYETGRAEEAAPLAQRALQLDPRLPDALFVLGASIQTARPAEASALYTRAISERPDFAPAFLKRAQCHLRSDQYDQAAADAAEAARLDPALKLDGCRLRLEAFKLAGKVDQAIAECGEWIKLAPKDPAPLVARSELHRTKGRAAEADRDLKAAAKLDPSITPPVPEPPRPRPPKPVSDREKREAMKKKLGEHFNAIQERVDLFDDGRYRVQLVYDFQSDKQLADFKMSNAAHEPGLIRLKSPSQEDNASCVWTGKIKGDFVFRAEWLVDEVHFKEVSAIFLRTAESDDPANPGAGVSVGLANVTAFDLKEWRMDLVKFAQIRDILTDENNPVLVRHNKGERCNVVFRREGAGINAQYGQSKPVKASTVGPDPNFIRIAVYAATIRLTRFEVIGYLDYDYVKSLE